MLKAFHWIVGGDLSILYKVDRGEVFDHSLGQLQQDAVVYFHV